MGVVYEAVRESLRGRVALKVMHPRFRASADYVRRIHNEARVDRRDSSRPKFHSDRFSIRIHREHFGTRGESWPIAHSREKSSANVSIKDVVASTHGELGVIGHPRQERLAAVR